MAWQWRRPPGLRPAIRKQWPRPVSPRNVLGLAVVSAARIEAELLPDSKQKLDSKQLQQVRAIAEQSLSLYPNMRKPAGRSDPDFYHLVDETSC